MTVHRLPDRDHAPEAGIVLPAVEVVDHLDAEALLDFATQAAALHARAMARLALGGQRAASESADGNKLLTAEAAAEKLGTTTDWLYRHHGKLPFTVQLSPQQLRFSAKGIDRWIALRQRAAHDR